MNRLLGCGIGVSKLITVPRSGTFVVDCSGEVVISVFVWASVVGIAGPLEGTPIAGLELAGLEPAAVVESRGASGGDDVAPNDEATGSEPEFNGALDPRAEKRAVVTGGIGVILLGGTLAALMAVDPTPATGTTVLGEAGDGCTALL